MAQLGIVMILAEGRTHGGGEVALWMRSIQLLCSERRRSRRTGEPDRQGEYDASHKSMNESHERQTCSYIWMYFGGNAVNAWMQFLTKLSGVATAMDGGSVDIERLYGYRRYETKDGRR